MAMQIHEQRQLNPVADEVFELARAVPTTPAGLYALLAVAANMEWAGPISENETEVLILQSAAQAAKRLIAASGATIN